MSTPTTPRPIADLDVEPQQVDAMEDMRLHLPLLDPDRHALDTTADAAFARLAPIAATPAQRVEGGAAA